MTSLYLASGSPRRQELLTQLGVSFERIVTGIEEKCAEGESAQQYVSRLAREKAQAGVAQTPRDLPVLGQIPSLFLTVKCLRNRTTLNMRRACCAKCPDKHIR